MKGAAHVPSQILGLTGYSADRTTLGHEDVPRLLEKFRGLSFTTSLQELDCHPSDSHWDVALENAKPVLEAAQTLVRKRLSGDLPFVFVTPRCATSLATLPAVADRYTDAIIIWIDAHGDLNTPETSQSGYLGGMPLSAAIGAWASGYGASVSGHNVIHVGARELGRGEASVANAHGIEVMLAPMSHGHLDRIMERCRDRNVYIHLDTDVFDRADIEAEYDEPDGLSLDTVRELLRSIVSVGRLVGLEVAEISPTSEPSRARSHSNLLSVIEPVLDYIRKQA